LKRRLGWLTSRRIIVPFYKYGSMFRFQEVILTARSNNVDQRGAKPMRPDARRSLDAILQAAKAVFAASGVDAPVRAIAERAGVGLGTLYRHFPQRADLIAAVFRREIDACADDASELAKTHPPFEALALWMRRYAAYVATKRGLAKALHSGDPAYDALPAHFDKRLRPALRGLLSTAVNAGVVRADVEADELLSAVASLGMSAYSSDLGRVERMVALLVDGLRYRAGIDDEEALGGSNLEP
jgi:AcrR family transcriptional regulator